MSEFIVHGIIGSPFVRAVLLALEEKGVPYRLAPLRPGAHRSAEYLARHPFGRVPMVEHGDFQLYETQAVLRYVDRLFPEPALTPKDPRQAARMDQLMGINDWYVMPQISAPIVFPLVVAPRIGMAGDESRIAEFMPKAEVCIAEIARLLGAQPYMAGEGLSPGRPDARAPAVVAGRLRAGPGPAGPLPRPQGVAGADAGAAEHAGHHLGPAAGSAQGRLRPLFEQERSAAYSLSRP
jgi:glutathione S-transferase